MSASWWLGNLAVYSVQVALVVAAAVLAAAALRLKQPRVMLAYWQALLAACLLLPLLQLWQRTGSGPSGGVTTIIGIETRDVDPVLGLLPLHAWVLPALLAGVSVGLLRLALGLWRLGHYRRAALRIAPLPSTLREAQALVGIEPAFYLSDRVESPVTFGWLDPAIIFPRRFEGMDEGQQRAIACHELLHVARHDWLTNLLQEIIVAFFWFHPAVWWVMRSIRLAREQVVDSQVVALTGARKPYLHALLEIAGASRAMAIPAPLFLTESQLARRVALLLKEARMSKPRLIASLVIAFAVLVAAGWWAVRTFHFMASPRTVSSVNSAPTMKYGLGKLDEVGGDVTAPVPIYKPEPAYTKEARAAKLQGSDVFWMVVDASGGVADIGLLRGLDKGLDENAIATLRTWKFSPALKKGKPVPVKVMVEVAFRLY
jgi:TonB family protein